MKKVFKGAFTLTEVLVAMAILGVIAAATLPQLTKSVQRDKAGITLGRAVEQIETGCQNMIYAYNNRPDADFSMAQTLNSLRGTNYSFSVNHLAPYIGAKSINNNANDLRFDKFPAEMIFPNPPINLDNDSPDAILIRGIVVDTNGLDKSPNEEGRDRFVFDLLNNGKLIPRGDETTCLGDAPRPVNADCTARVVRDGFKIKYNW